MRIRMNERELYEDILKPHFFHPQRAPSVSVSNFNTVFFYKHRQSFQESERTRGKEHSVANIYSLIFEFQI